MRQRRRRELALAQFPPVRAFAISGWLRPAVARALPAVAVAVVLTLGLAQPAGARSRPTSRLAQQTQMFTLHTDVSGLYPGATVTAQVRVDNPQSEPITVESATITVTDASASCTRTNLSADPFAGRVTVPAAGTGNLPIRIHMAAAAPDACQGAVFPLVLVATGVVDSSPPVDPRTPSPALPLAFTGASRIVFLGGVALGAIALGALLVTARRRTRRTQPID
jgi:hypothetical protein